MGVMPGINVNMHPNYSMGGFMAVMYTNYMALRKQRTHYKYLFNRNRVFGGDEKQCARFKAVVRSDVQIVNIVCISNQKYCAHYSYNKVYNCHKLIQIHSAAII